MYIGDLYRFENDAAREKLKPYMPVISDEYWNPKKAAEQEARFDDSTVGGKYIFREFLNDMAKKARDANFMFSCEFLSAHKNNKNTIAPSETFVNIYINPKETTIKEIEKAFGDKIAKAVYSDKNSDCYRLTAAFGIFNDIYDGTSETFEQDIALTVFGAHNFANPKGELKTTIMATPLNVNTANGENVDIFAFALASELHHTMIPEVAEKMVEKVEEAMRNDSKPVLQMFL